MSQQLAIAWKQFSAKPADRPDKCLEDALAEFKTVLTNEQRKELDREKSIPDSNAVLVFTAKLDAKRRALKGRSIASRLHAVLQCVRDFSTVIDVLVSSRPEIAALVWGSVKLTMLVSCVPLTCCMYLLS